jgi:hypothetical protein
VPTRKLPLGPGAGIAVAKNRTLEEKVVGYDSISAARMARDPFASDGRIKLRLLTDSNITTVIRF